MTTSIIKISSKEKYTSIRLSERTKKMLDSVAQGKETHDQIVIRLVHAYKSFTAEPTTRIIEKGHIIWTRYEKIHKTVIIQTSKSEYSVVCTYNDLNIFANYRNNKQLMTYVSEKGLNPEWEADLEIVNIKKNKDEWEQPAHLAKKDKQEYLLLYFVCLKQILEETFLIKMTEFTTDKDYFDTEYWEKAYKYYSLSKESLYSDVLKKLEVNR